ncbi:plasmid partitioning protein RepB [Sinirhodobacter populi]|uniref:Plasmid partitioning protein RepB n=1 Tax=Paenirhodobacter populi TaxID=2306993 RepID=A0A443KCM7_9RHOB|nr:plasmid partitioning protein RepB [Sinirhodobacter populi]RWR30567.1 plasmid partitioning protein RepB [Sinirhodobacter populi]
MARKNIFIPPLEGNLPTEKTPATSPALRSYTKSVAEAQSHGVQSLDVESIENDGPADRLTVEGQELASLIESIKENGQLVPVLVRTVPNSLNRYRVVYGRRRIAAIRAIGGGMRVNAIVKTLNDRESVIYQGLENNERLDPSFIEIALFASSLLEEGHDRATIKAALSVSSATLSRMESVTKVLPIEIIEMIGRAPAFGRRTWLALAEIIANIGVVESVSRCREILNSPNAPVDSDKRLSAVISGLRKDKSVAVKASSRPLPSQPGFPRMSLSRNTKSVSIEVKISDDAMFAEWFASNADALASLIHDKWQRNRNEHE